jgi:hypothetical protein
MAHDRCLLVVERVEQIGNIESLISSEVDADGRPLAIAVAAQIQCDHMPALCSRYPGITKRLRGFW